MVMGAEPGETMETGAGQSGEMGGTLETGTRDRIARSHILLVITGMGMGTIIEVKAVIRGEGVGGMAGIGGSRTRAIGCI